MLIINPYERGFFRVGSRGFLEILTRAQFQRIDATRRIPLMKKRSLDVCY